MVVPDIPDTTFDIFLQPGEHYFGDEDTTIRTVLGSCVAVVFWHPSRRIGGMCHYMLPGRPGGRAAGEPRDGRYADEAMQLLYQEIGRTGTRPEDYQVKVFGGGNMFPRIGGGNRLDVGSKNVAAVREMTRRLGLNVVAEHLGGHGHRNVVYVIATGDVWVRFSTTSQVSRE